MGMSIVGESTDTWCAPTIAFTLELIYHLRFELVFSLAFFVALTVSGKLTNVAKARDAVLKPKKKSEDIVHGRAEMVATSIMDLCGTQYAKGMEMFQQNQATLENLDNTQFRALVNQLAISSVRVGYCDRVKGLLELLAARNMPCDDTLLLSALKVLSTRKKFKNTVEIYNQWVGIFGEPTLGAVRSCMLHCYVETEHYDMAEKVFKSMHADRQVGARDYATFIRLNVLTNSWERAVEQIREMKKSGMVPDCVAYNMVLSACANAHQVAEVDKLFGEMHERDTVTINTRLKAYAQNGEVDKCEKFLEEMKTMGVAPSAVTYGTMLEGYMKAGDVDAAKRTMAKMTDQGVEKNAIIYTIMISGMSRAGNVDDALAMFREMKECAGIVPDVICYSVLIKALCDSSRVSEAIELFEDLLRSGHQPDEILFNNLLSGCVKVPAVDLANQLLNDMVRNNIRTTNATFSIMLKVYSSAKEFREAENLLSCMEARYNIRPESRLFLQHIMAAIRARKGPSVVAVVKILLEQYPKTNLDQVLQCCCTFNLLETACQLVQENAESFSPHEVNKLVNTLDRKNKRQLADRIRSKLS